METRLRDEPFAAVKSEDGTNTWSKLHEEKNIRLGRQAARLPFPCQDSRMSRQLN